MKALSPWFHTARLVECVRKAYSASQPRTSEQRTSQTTQSRR